LFINMGEFFRLPLGLEPVLLVDAVVDEGQTGEPDQPQIELIERHIPPQR
jgi:hypothetical protein